MNTKDIKLSKIPLPVDLNELPDGTRSSDSPAPSQFIPLRHRLPERPEPSDLDRLKKTIDRTVHDLNISAPALPPPPGSLSNLEHISAEINSLLMASAQTMVTEANNLLAQTQAWADKLNLEIRAKIAEHTELTERLKAFGQTVLDAHNKYHEQQK